MLLALPFFPFILACPMLTVYHHSGELIVTILHHNGEASASP
jgi:hypothetical protein